MITKSAMFTASVILLTGALLAMPFGTAVAGKPSGGTAIRVEDLRPLLPMHKTSYATLVNNAGTVVIAAEFLDSTCHGFVITSAGQTLELGPGETVPDLNESDQMIGSRRDPSQALPDKPLFWASPSGPATKLPVIQS